MTYFIYNHRLTGEQQAIEAQSIAEDQEILWQGTKEEFEALGFTEEQVGGLKLENGVLVFDENIRKEKEEIAKPLAMGTDLIRFINERTEAALDDLTAFGIVSKLKDFMIYCQQGRCNPFTQKTFNTILQTLDAVFQNVEKKLIIDLTQEWAKSVKFKHEPAKPEGEGKGTDKAEPPPLEVQQLVKGNCPTPQSLDKRGRKCGKRAASVKG